MGISFFCWLNGITVVVWLSLGVIWGMISIYRAFKLKTKQLLYLGLSILSISLLFSGLVADFVHILLFGRNLDNSTGIHGILTFLWFVPLIFIGTVLFTELVIPEIKKWVKMTLILYMLVLCTLFAILLIIYPFASIDFKYPSQQGEGLIDNVVIAWSPIYLLLGMTLLPGIFIFGSITLYQALKTTGVVRKKLILLFCSLCLFFGFGSIDLTIYLPDILLLGTRYVMILGGVLFYFSIREKKIKESGKISLNSEKIEESTDMFVESISQPRPVEINQEDVEFYRNETLCMVCKNNLVGFKKLYICPDCKAMYCEDCARELIKLDNMCWGCLGPIDKSLPTKHVEQVEDEIIVELPLEEGRDEQKYPK